ncbi:helix-turn-helix transcriptional regulator [Halomarina rubra]|uniref:Helix-turn-helix transcriptional regulator n=1 Tax=Halomarina rubra TaxID=2071873 RepID=A0ABD6B1G2_9EURY|nr:MarR family transcriptional regulator [Halomarina rubra]
MDETRSAFFDLLRRRAPVIRELNTGPTPKPTVVERLDVSRSTVDRAVRELTAHDLVERTDGGFRTTLAGRLALETLDRIDDQVTGLRGALDVLSVLPRDASIPPSFFAGAAVVTPSPVAPHRPVERNAELLSWADHVRGLISAVSGQYVENYRSAIDAGTTVELGFPTPVLQELVTTYGLAGDPVFEHDHVEVREIGGSLPCSVKIHECDGERVASLTVYGPDGLQGLITNDAPRAVAWAESYIGRRWRDAERLPSP